jgi:hypothetical protein
VLEEAFRKLNRKSVSGVDAVTWKEYESNLEANLFSGSGSESHSVSKKALFSRPIPIPMSTPTLN